MNLSTTRAKSPRKRASDKSKAEILKQWEGDPSFMQSLARGLLVLDVVARAQGGFVSISDLVKLTGLPRATVRRSIYTLEAVGFLRSVGDGAAPGPEVIVMTTALIASKPLLAAHEPIISKLRDDTGQGVMFGLYEEWRAVFVSNVPSRASVTIHSLPTMDFPHYATSIGRLLLAFKSDGEIDEYFKSVGIGGGVRTARALSKISDIKAAIQEVRARGYSIVDEEVELGLRSITVPVLSGRGTLAAWINIRTHPNITGIRELKSKILPKMQRAAEELSRLAP